MYTAGVHAERHERAARPLRQLTRCEDDRCLRAVVALSDVVRLRAGVLDRVQVHTIAERVCAAAEEHHAWGEARCGLGCEELGREELREEEVPDMVDGYLGFQPVNG